MKDKPVVFFVCSGLGRINRGYETFMRECFDTLKDSEEFEMHLLKGGGPGSSRERVIGNLHRNSEASLWLGKLFGKEPYFIEQLTFCLSMIPLLLRKKPALIYYSDFILGTFLWNLRKRMNMRYNLLFSNGAPNGPPFSRCDAVHQLVEHQRKLALDYGESPDKHFVVPYGFTIAPRSVEGRDKERERTRMGIPVGMTVVLSVGALNNHHKRMGYLIREVHALNRNDVFLQLLGNHERESEEVVRLGNSLLGTQRFSARTVPGPEVQDYYRIADVFVLASLTEGFGRVYIEALSNGLKIIAHRSETTEEILGKTAAILVDMLPEGGVTDALRSYLQEGAEQNALTEQDHELLYKLYSWPALKARYIEMIK